MAYATLGIFLIALVGGTYVGLLHLKGEPPPSGVALVHGMLSLVGLVLLIYLVATAPELQNGLALLLFLITIGGGFYLYRHRAAQKRPERAPILIHAAFAVAAVATLALVVIR